MGNEFPIQEVVIVIIQKEDKFLFQKNHKWQDLSFIGGKIEPTDPSPIEAAYRECEEELHLERNKDYLLTPLEPRLYEERKLSKRTGQITQYKFYLFRMNFRSDISQKIDEKENVWMGKEEIEHPHPGTKLSEIVQTVFPLLDL